jgi:hypothetical protein
MKVVVRERNNKRVVSITNTQMRIERKLIIDAVIAYKNRMENI